ncbi:DUF7343 domain-containing protein [Haladaptatus sp. DFWS20]|uniref:helix-turn-helix transcriptional regulator n=1 Tax=Haladaptatus sp. DFWS20 TaxID=3403467 RepID=UPI003EB7FB95
MHLGSGNRGGWALYAVLVVALVVSGVALVPMSAGGQSESDIGRIVSVNQTGTAIVTTNNDTTYVWQSEQYTANVTFQINGKKDQYEVCLYETRSSGRSEKLKCRSTKVGNGSTATVSLSGSNASETGERTLIFRLKPTFGQDSPTLDSRTIDQRVIQKSGDVDNDGLENEFEVNQSKNAGWNETAFLDWDMDDDGNSDGAEYDDDRLDPTKADTDTDGLPDGLELDIGTNPNAPDSDGDKIDDGTEYNDPNLDPRDPNDSTTTETTSVVSEPQPDESDDILTDEGVVLKLLRENRGRMKQVDVVEETGWSKSKVSRLLSRMEERGDVNRLRVGRGNIVYLDGAKPSGARSPHEGDIYS